MLFSAVIIGRFVSQAMFFFDLPLYISRRISLKGGILSRYSPSSLTVGYFRAFSSRCFRSQSSGSPSSGWFSKSSSAQVFHIKSSNSILLPKRFIVYSSVFVIFAAKITSTGYVGTHDFKPPKPDLTVLRAYFCCKKPRFWVDVL